MLKYPLKPINTAVIINEYRNVKTTAIALVFFLQPKTANISLNYFSMKTYVVGTH